MPGVRTSRQRPAPPGLLAKLGNAGRPAGRDESGTVAEACPAASLEHWDIPCRGYKQPRNLSALTEFWADSVAERRVLLEARAGVRCVYRRSASSS